MQLEAHFSNFCSGWGRRKLPLLSCRTRATRHISLSPSLNKMPTLQSATLLASTWPCHRCSHLNDSSRNKKRCSLFSCRARRDGPEPLSAKGGGTSTSGAAASGVGLVDNDATCRDENGPPNNASSRRDGSPTKSRGGTKTKRKSPSRGLSRVLCPSTPPSPPALRPMRRITASLPSECRGISNSIFGQALTFAAMSMQHTVNQLQQWAKEPDLRVKNFASSILLTSRSICLPFQGMVLNRTSNSREGFVFCAESCSGISSRQRFNSGLRCSFCDSQKKCGSEKIRQSIKSSTGCVGKQATIQKKSMNPALAAMEIRMAREEIRRLRCELARIVLQKVNEKDGAVLPDGAAGDQIRQAVGIMDGLVTKALQLGAAQEALELWWVHTEHINRVFENGGKGRGFHNATYHPKFMNWAIAFLARTSSGTYNEVAKIFMLPHIRTVYQKTAEIITTKNDKAYCLHMNTIQSISDRAHRENWTSHQRIGAIAQATPELSTTMCQIL
jgi:hypothetical protein